MATSALYRLRQLFAAIAGRLSGADWAVVGAMLTPAELRLFARMPRYDQRHCLDVFDTLRAGGYDDPALLAAALLHDCGKVGDDGRPIPLIYYGAFVVTQGLVPGVYRWAARVGRGPLRPFAVHAAHDQRSARMVAAAGSPRALVTILDDYAARRATAQARALAWADEQN